jgi:hypothetical protein
MRREDAMGRQVSLDDPDHCWSRAKEAKADAEWMPDPDTRRLTLTVAENYEQLARHLEIRARRQRFTPRYQAPFQQGYIAGWQSVRGADDHPILVPQSPVFVGQAMYMVGFSRGARDAGPSILLR